MTAHDPQVALESIRRHGGKLRAVERETGIRREQLWVKYAAEIEQARQAGPVQEPLRKLEDSAVVTNGAESIEAMINRLVEQRIAKMAGDTTIAIAPDRPASPPQVEIHQKSRIVRPEKQYKRVAVVSDLHVPFIDKAAWSVAMQAIRDYKPDYLVINGDAFDCYSISRFNHKPERADYVQDEFDEARPLWKEIDDLGCDVAMIEGNHDDRIAQLAENKPGLHKLRCLELRNAAEMPKRWAVYPNQTRIRLGGLAILHGDLKGMGAAKHVAHNLYNRLKVSCLVGHYHRQQSHLDRTDDGTYRGGFAMGCLCDIDEVSHEYATNAPWQNGFATIDMDWDHDIFAVNQHLIANGKAIIHGKTYAA